MKQDKFPMTQSGLEQLKKELADLETSKREQVHERIKHARTFCDFNEDSEYEAALNELAVVEERIAKLEYMIQQASIIKATDNDIIEMGSTISLYELPNDNIETYTIVGVEEAEPSNGHISYQSPMAQSLLGAKSGDVIHVATPSGSRRVKIVHVS